MIEEFSKNVADAALILGIAAGVGPVGAVIVNDVTKPNSVILGYTALVLVLAGSMTIKNYVTDRFSSENNLEEEEDEDIEEEDGVSSSDDGGRCGS